MPDTASDPAAPAPLVPPVSPLLLDRIIRHSDRLAADMLREIPGERVWAARIAVYGGLLIAALFDLPPAARQLALDAHVDGLRVLTGEDGIVGEADRMQALWREITARIDALHAAFGAPGDYGYGTATGDALFALYKLRSLSLDDAKQRALAGEP